MTPVTVFPSKRDAWLVALLVSSLAMSTATPVFLAVAGRAQPAEILASVALVIVVDLFVASVMLGTRYTLFEDKLVVRSSLFRWTVPLAEITLVEPTGNPLSSPALSLDRLRIEYAGGKEIMISPPDKDAFVRALAARAGLVVRGPGSASR